MKTAILAGSGRVLLEPETLIVVRCGMLDVHFPYSSLIVDSIHVLGVAGRPLEAQVHGVCELAVFPYAQTDGQVRRWALDGRAFFEQLMPGFDRVERLVGTPVPFCHGSLSPKVHRMQAWLNASLDRPLNLSAVAAHSNLGTFAASRLFHEATGMTLRAYAKRIRLRNAIARMRSDPNVTRTAQDFGFCDLAHFSKAFKAEFGLGPSAFLKALERGWSVA